MSAYAPSTPPTSATGEERVDARRYLSALARSAWLILAIVVVVTAVVLAVSLVLPPRYEATVTLVQEDISTPLEASSADSAQRKLLTTAALLDTRRVLARTAASIPGETAASLEEKVESSVDDQANIIEVSATDGDPRRAAAIANGVARSFLSERRTLERTGLRNAQRSLEREIDRLRGTPNADAEVGAIRERISELGVQSAAAGSDVQLAQAAEAPSSASSPKPLRNAVLALFAATLLGVLIALGRDQLVPRVNSSRDLSRLVDVPVLIEIPDVKTGIARRRALLTAAENEAYQALRASLEVAVPPTEQRTLLISSAVHGEGKTTVTARLGRALAESGHSTLLVSADLRRPQLHHQFGVPNAAGVGDALSVIHQSRGDAGPALQEALRAAISTIPLSGRGRRKPGRLALLNSGSNLPDPARIISYETVSRFIEELGSLDYRYVLFDGPPLLGIADSQVIAQEVDQLLIVARLDTLRLENVNDLSDALARTGKRPLGLAVIGGRAEMSPYYLPSAAIPAEERAA